MVLVVAELGQLLLLLLLLLVELLVVVLVLRGHLLRQVQVLVVGPLLQSTRHTHWELEGGEGWHS